MSEHEHGFEGDEEAIAFLEAAGFKWHRYGKIRNVFWIPYGVSIRSEDLEALLYLRHGGRWDFEQV